MPPVFADETSDVAEKYNKFLSLLDNNQEEANDVVRDAFQRAHQQLTEFREGSRALTDMIDSVLMQTLRNLRR